MYLQLLAATIQHEKPELEEKKTALLKQEEDLKIELAKLEESLLEVRNIPLKHIDISCLGGRTGLVVRASDSGSGDPGSILGRVGVLFP